MYKGEGPRAGQGEHCAGPPRRPAGGPFGCGRGQCSLASLSEAWAWGCGFLCRIVSVPSLFPCILKARLTKTIQAPLVPEAKEDSKGSRFLDDSLGFKGSDLPREPNSVAATAKVSTGVAGMWWRSSLWITKAIPWDRAGAQV